MKLPTKKITNTLSTILVMTFIIYGCRCSTENKTPTPTRIKRCTIYDTDDINNLDSFVTFVKENLKKYGKKLNPTDTLMNWQNQISNDTEAGTTTNNNNNTDTGTGTGDHEPMEDCFALTESQAKDMFPVVKIKSFAGWRKMAQLSKDTSISTSTHSMDSIIEVIDEIQKHGIEYVCKYIIVPDGSSSSSSTNSGKPAGDGVNKNAKLKFNPTFVNICKIINNFSHN